MYLNAYVSRTQPVIRSFQLGCFRVESSNVQVFRYAYISLEPSLSDQGLGSGLGRRFGLVSSLSM